MGERENNPDRGWPILPAAMQETLSGLDMVTDLARFTARLREHQALKPHSEVIPDEQHATVWPAAVTRGLVHLYRTAPADQPGSPPPTRRRLASGPPGRIQVWFASPRRACRTALS